MVTTDANQWAEETFKEAELGDPRRKKRLIKLASDIAANYGESVVKASEDSASIEGAYRFIRNPSITAEDIALAGFKTTDKQVKQTPLVLSLQDSTGLSYRHSIREELGSVSSANSNKKAPKGRSLFVHSTLMLNADTEQVMGLANQHYWYREQKVTGTKRQQQNRTIKDKESYKWQRNIEQLTTRLGSLDNVIDVCDREADMYEYLDYQVTHGNRFVVRLNEDRRLLSSKDKLSDALSRLESCGHYSVKIMQKGGRKSRQAKMALSYTQVELKKPRNAKGSAGIRINVIQCQEVGPDDSQEKLCWKLYTSEAIESLDDARKIVRYYELRWRIEEFHKVWKSDGTQVESLRMQKRDNLKRIAVILAFVAVRLYQMRDIVQNNKAAKNESCQNYLSPISWKVLWKATEKSKSLPDKAPSLYWAYYAIAKLGKWHDSKRNGRVGIPAFWKGWIKLGDLIESYEMFKGIDLE